MDIYTATEQAYKNGYSAAIDHYKELINIADTMATILRTTDSQLGRNVAIAYNQCKELLDKERNHYESRYTSKH